LKYNRESQGEGIAYPQLNLLASLVENLVTLYVKASHRLALYSSHEREG